MVPTGATTSEDASRHGSQSLGFMVGMVLSLALALCFVMVAESGGKGAAIRPVGHINPNTALPSSLTRLPGIGPTRALAIVAYRHRIQEETGHEAVFRHPDDLRRIRGIGSRTVEDIAPWLDFGQPSPNAAENVHP